MEHVAGYLASLYNKEEYMLVDEMWDVVVRYTNFQILDGKSYLAWIISDPNFKITFRQSGRALVLAKVRQTDRQKTLA